MFEVLSGTMMLTGGVLAVIAGAGLQRFEDVFARMHAATKPATLGLALIVIGAAMRMPDAGSVAKLLLVLVLQFVTAPVGSHLVGRASYWAGTEMSPHTTPDDLAAAGPDDR